MNVEIGAEAALFPEKEYIKGIFVAVHTEFKGSPEYAPWHVLYHTSLRNYASFSLQVPSNLSLLLGRDAVPGDGGGAPPARAQAQETIQEALLRLGLRRGPPGMQIRIS
jgi:hypothetical protein